MENMAKMSTAGTSSILSEEAVPETPFNILCSLARRAIERTEGQINAAIELTGRIDTIGDNLMGSVPRDKPGDHCLALEPRSDMGGAFGDLELLLRMNGLRQDALEAILFDRLPGVMARLNHFL